MKATLNFDLSDSEERKEHLRCVLSTKMANVLWEMHNNGYRKIIGDEIDNLDYELGVSHVFSHLEILMEENGININELID